MKPRTVRVVVRRMIADGKLAQERNGLVTNTALNEFYRDHGTELDR